MWRLLVLPFRLDVQGISRTSVGVVFSWILWIQQRLVVVLHDAALTCYQQLSTLITRPEGNVQNTSQHLDWTELRIGDTASIKKRAVGFNTFFLYTLRHHLVMSNKSHYERKVIINHVSISKCWGSRCSVSVAARPCKYRYLNSWVQKCIGSQQFGLSVRIECLFLTLQFHTEGIKNTCEHTCNYGGNNKTDK